MSRVERFKEKRRLMDSDREIVQQSTRLEAKLVSQIAAINKLNPAILRNYKKTDVAAKSITVIDKIDRSGIEELKKHLSQIDGTRLSAYVEKYESDVAAVTERKSFTKGAKSNLVLIAPKQTLEYEEFEKKYENYLDIDVQKQIKALATKQNLEHIDKLVQRVAQRHQAGESITSKQNQLDITTAQDSAVRFFERKPEELQKMVGQEFFSQIGTLSQKSGAKIKMRKWIMVLAVLAALMALACIIVFVLYSLRVI